MHTFITLTLSSKNILKVFKDKGLMAVEKFPIKNIQYGENVQFIGGSGFFGSHRCRYSLPVGKVFLRSFSFAGIEKSRYFVSSSQEMIVWWCYSDKKLVVEVICKVVLCNVRTLHDYGEIIKEAGDDPCIGCRRFQPSWRIQKC